MPANSLRKDLFSAAAEIDALPPQCIMQPSEADRVYELVDMFRNEVERVGYFLADPFDSAAGLDKEEVITGLCLAAAAA